MQTDLQKLLKSYKSNQTKPKMKIKSKEKDTADKQSAPFWGFSW